MLPTLRRLSYLAVPVGYLFLLWTASGCQSKSAATPENLLLGLNAYLAEHPRCLYVPAPRFPYETSDPTEVKQMDALVADQLLTVTEERAIKVRRYTPTTTGARYAPGFCYGRRVASTIESHTAPVEVSGFPQTHVVYHYAMQDVPVWAKSAQMTALFPGLATDLSGTATGKATLAATIAGWRVPD